MKTKTIILLLMLLPPFLSLQGCDWLDELLNNPKENSIEDNSVLFTIKTDKFRYKIGEEVNVEYTVKNNKTETVNFECTAAPIDKYKIEKNGQEIYTTYPSYLCLMGYLDLESGESYTYYFTWEQVDEDRNPVGTGRYIVSAWLDAGKPWVYVSVEIEIVE